MPFSSKSPGSYLQQMSTVATLYKIEAATHVQGVQVYTKSYTMKCKTSNPGSISHFQGCSFPLATATASRVSKRSPRYQMAPFDDQVVFVSQTPFKWLLETLRQSHLLTFLPQRTLCDYTLHCENMHWLVLWRRQAKLFEAAHVTTCKEFKRNLWQT